MASKSSKSPKVLLNNNNIVRAITSDIMHEQCALLERKLSEKSMVFSQKERTKRAKIFQLKGTEVLVKPAKG